MKIKNPKVYKGIIIGFFIIVLLLLFVMLTTLIYTVYSYITNFFELTFLLHIGYIFIFLCGVAYLYVEIPDFIKCFKKKWSAE